MICCASPFRGRRGVPRALRLPEGLACEAGMANNSTSNDKTTHDNDNTTAATTTNTIYIYIHIHIYIYICTHVYTYLHSLFLPLSLYRSIYLCICTYIYIYIYIYIYGTRGWSCSGSTRRPRSSATTSRSSTRGSTRLAWRWWPARRTYLPYSTPPSEIGLGLCLAAFAGSGGK